MAKPKLFTTKELLAIIHKYFQSDKKENGKLTFTTLAKFAQEELEIGGIEYYHFGRNEEVKAKVNEYNNKLRKKDIEYVADNSSFSTLNVREFVKTHGGNPQRLLTMLTNMQEMHKKLYDRTVDAELKVKQISTKLDELKLKNKELSERNEKLFNENKSYKLALDIKQEEQLISALNSTGLYLVERENGQEFDHNEDIKQINDSNGKNLEKLMEEFEDLYD
ncbi:hypothetical protein [Paenibacillus sp. GXUN7292]|uniref:hypothetical protein n=1 Tax=Paenibacillus sp. GXUN7292 TaxID=3422499 RepID=UPI003D7CBCEC